MPRPTAEGVPVSSERTGRSLAENRQRLAQALRWPDNLGIVLRDLSLGALPGTPALLLWVDGLAGSPVIAASILSPLASYRGSTAPELLAQQLPIPDQHWEAKFDQIIERVLAGYTALLVDGWEAALVLDTVAPRSHPSWRGLNLYRESFSQDMRENIALLRKRVRDPRLLALPIALPRPDRGHVALVYVEGKALPSLVRLVRQWVRCHVGEEMVLRGLMGGFPATLGALPRFDSSGFSDDMAQLVTMGYVLVFVDRTDRVYAAPVSMPAWFTSAGDAGIAYPLRRFLLLMRLTLYGLVLMLPGSLIALMNYHVDMVPTAFLTAMTSARENAPFGLLFEVLIGEAIIEVGREVSFRIPVKVSPGLAMVTLVLIMLLLTQSGFISPLTAVTSVMGALFSLALPSNSGTFLVRAWRIYLLLGAAVLGFFGMATLLAMLLAYLCRTRRWGIPVWGPSGLGFTAPEGPSSRPPRRSGGKHPWQTPG